MKEEEQEREEAEEEEQGREHGSMSTSGAGHDICMRPVAANASEWYESLKEEKRSDATGKDEEERGCEESRGRDGGKFRGDRESVKWR